MKQTFRQRLIQLQKKSKTQRVEGLVKFLKSRIEREFSLRSPQAVEFDYNKLFDFTPYGRSYTEVRLAVAKIAAEGISISIDEDDNCKIKVSL